ncbi:hypothetical protein AVEN_274066-1 [Araneus ventricosus]|uniref:Uncharacterized protein n=1 Tax=Araneus ventricosus TaxID=182803 RepID=A0A4Y2MW97_ARAVE|nr:hypothetical protein AVEN_274066-1 [Araneus ventricosus]
MTVIALIENVKFADWVDEDDLDIRGLTIAEDERAMPKCSYTRGTSTYLLHGKKSRSTKYLVDRVVFGSSGSQMEPNPSKDALSVLDEFSPGIVEIIDCRRNEESHVHPTG